MKDTQKDTEMPYKTKCSSGSCRRIINTRVEWKPRGHIYYIKCPHCNWVNKRQLKQGTLEAWFHSGHDEKIDATIESIMELIDIVGSATKLTDFDKERLSELKKCIFNVK
jgi:hypothetical protein